MMDGVLLKLPEIQGLLGLLTVQTIEISNGKTLSAADKAEMIARRAVLVSTLDGLRSKTAGLPAAFRNDSTPTRSLEPTLRGPLGQVGELGGVFAKTLDEKVLKPEEARLSLEDALQGQEALVAAFELWDKAVVGLDDLLARRIAGFERERLTILGIVAATVIVALGLVLYLVRSFTGQLSAVAALMTQISAGDYKKRCAVQTKDELGDVARSINGMLDETLKLIQSKDEKEEIQRAITKLLGEVADVANGDLTRTAEVTADMTGAIADSFNYMLDQLRRIISNVKQATLQVSTSAHAVVNTTEELASRSVAQTDQILNTSTTVEEMATTIHQVSETAAQSATVAQQALTNAQQGNETVQKTILGMTRIRDQVQETAKRIKRLGESSQEIGQIIQIINDIADRTSILALNASIQAAMAGEAGRGFAVVAEEVERLADRSTDATKKIAGLVMAIQSETHEAVGAMEKSIQEVVEGSRLVNQAGRALTDIETSSANLSELILAISVAARQQAQVSEDVARSMNQISETTQTTSAGTKEAAQTINRLASMAETLRESVSQFRLPETEFAGASTSA